MKLTFGKTSTLPTVGPFGVATNLPIERIEKAYAEVTRPDLNREFADTFNNKRVKDLLEGSQIAIGDMDGKTLAQLRHTRELPGIPGGIFEASTDGKEGVVEIFKMLGRLFQKHLT